MYEQCPACMRERKTLRVFTSNVRCHACGYHRFTNNNAVTTLEGNVMQKVSLPPLIEPFDWSSKKLTSRVLDLYGVGMTPDGRVISPHYSPDMQLLGIHTRTPGERDFRFNGNHSPFGLHTLGNNPQELIICEGHTDVLSAKVMFPSCDVIGVAGSDSHTTLQPYLSKIRKYRRITVMVDDDTSGGRLQQHLVDMLPSSKTRICHLSGGRDVSDYLVYDLQDELHNLYKLATSNKKGRFVTPEDCDKYATSAAYDTVSTGIDALDSILGGGIGVAELTLMTGYTGTGKSALAQQVAVNAARNGVKVLYLAGEMTPKQNLDRLCRQWYGGRIRKDDVARCYKEVSASILINKFSDLTLDNVVDTVQEAVLDYGVRLVIIDVLSDVDEFLSTDMTKPASIIKKIHRVSLGDEQDDVPPCAVLCVAHTKGQDEGTLRPDSIRGGSVIRQEATCIIGFSEQEQGNMSNTFREVSLLKRPRNRDHTSESVTLNYNTDSQRYTEVAQVSTPANNKRTSHNHGTTQDSNEGTIRLQPREKLPQPTSAPGIPPESHDVRLREQATDASLHDVTSADDTDAVTIVESTSAALPTGLLLPTDTPGNRDEGIDAYRGPHEVQSSSADAPYVPVQVSSPTDRECTHVTTPAVTAVTSDTGTIPDKLDSLRRMYERNPDVLERHRTRSYKTNPSIRSNLAALGYAVQ